MANRSYGNQYKSNVVQPVKICFQWVQDAATPLQVSRGRMVTSVTRTAAGLFDVVFADFFTQLYGVSGIVLGVAAALDSYVQVAAYNAALGTMSLRTKTAGANVDPANGDQVFVECVFSNSSVDP